MFMVIIIIIGFCLWLYMRFNRMTLLHRCGIPGPSPHFIVGNMRQFYSMGAVDYHTYLSQKYGPICGYYIGGKPFILITEPTEEGKHCLMKEMFNSQSKHFLTRLRRIPGGINPDPLRNLMLGNLPIDKWRTNRKILQSAFSNNRLKEMIPQIKSVVDTLIEELRDSSDKEIDIHPIYQRFVIRLIAKIIFGFSADSQCNLTDQLVNIANKATRKSKFMDDLLLKAYFLFPEFDPIFKWLRIIGFYLRLALGIEKRSELWDIAHSVTEMKKKQTLCSQTHKQFVDILIESSLTDIEIYANFIVFFESVYDNLSSALTFFTHVLLIEDRAQHLLREEATEAMANNEFDDNSMSALKLMESAITEMFRLYAPETVLSRTSDTNFQYKNLTIPSGVHIAIGTYQLHRMESVWKEADRYVIDRFIKTGKCVNSLNWQAFGAGPRQCFGFQFTYLVMKLLFSQMLVNFELLKTTNTESQLSLQHKVATIAPKSGLVAMFRRR